MEKIEERTIKEKAKKAAFEKAIRTVLTVSTPLSIFMSIAVLHSDFPGLGATAFLFVVSLIVFVLSYDEHFERYCKKFSEEVENKER